MIYVEDSSKSTASWERFYHNFVHKLFSGVINIQRAADENLHHRQYGRFLDDRPRY